MKCLENRVHYIDKELSFPVNVIVNDSEDNWEIKDGDHAIIELLPHIVDMYGIIASINPSSI